MKLLFALGLTLATLFTTATNATEASAGPTATIVSGEVLEVRDVENYSYLRLKTKDGETWAAVTTAAIKKGAKVTIENAMVMKNFESKALNKTFPSIVFGNLAGAGKGTPGVGPGVVKAVDAAPIHVPKASGANAHTVAEIMTTAAALKDKPVRVRGKVVKYNPGIMGKNWIHLRDGSGTAADNTDDVLVTTLGQAKLGDIVTVTGVVRTDKNFGSGYAYKVLLEDATLQP